MAVESPADGSRGWLYRPDYPEDWTRRSLHSMAKWVNGLAFRNFQFSDSGMPVLKIAEIKSGITEQTKLTQQTFDDAVRVRPGDLLFSWSGNPDTSIDAFWWRGPEGWLNQHIFKVTPADGVDTDFFYYLLRYLKPHFAAIARNKQTTGLGHVTKRDLERIDGAMPSWGEQRAIASILGALDDKIELNRRMSETLEEMARAYFGAWLAEVQGSEAEDPSGSVPLAEVVTEHKEKWVPTGASPVLHFSLPAFDAGGQPVLEPGTAIKSAKTVVPKGAVLVSRLNPRITRVWLVDFADDHLGVASTEFLVATPKAPYGRSFLFLTASSDDFQGSLISMATGTSGSHQRVRPGAVLSVRVPSAPESELRRLEQVAGPILDRVLVAQRESTTLAALRDALLPKLISGELRVPDAERLVSEVA